jgi:hypothetical protein
MICATLFILMSYSIVGSEENHQTSSSSDNIIPLFYMGVPAAFVNTGQFDNELKKVGLRNLTIPYGIRLGWGYERPPTDPHFYSIRLDWNFLHSMVRQSQTRGELSFNEILLHGGYRYRPVTWFSIRTDIGIGVDQWSYEIISPDSSGRLDGLYLLLQPEVALTFHLPFWIFADVFGGYQFNLVNFATRYAGEWTKNNFDLPNLDHTVVGLEIGFRFQ